MAVNDHATAESRSRGGLARAAKIRERREEVERIAMEKMEGALEKAVGRYVDALDAGTVTVREQDGEEVIDTDHKMRVQAADRIADRIMGKPVQRTELTGAGGGPVVLENDVDAATASRILAGLGGRVGAGSRDASNGDASADEVHPA